MDKDTNKAEQKKPVYDVDKLTPKERNRRLLAGQLLKRTARLLKVEQIEKALRQEFPDVDLHIVDPITLTGLILSVIRYMGEGPEIQRLSNKYQKALEGPRIDFKTASYEEVNEYLNQSYGKMNRLALEIFDMTLGLNKVGELNINFNKSAWPEWIEDKDPSGYISVANSQVYHNFRNKLAAGAFSGTEGWPETDISGSRVKGRALLKPENISPVAKEEALLELQKTMKDKVMDLTQNGDLAVDILDIVIAKHIKTSDNPYEPIRITADDFLQARGIKKVLGGSGRRGGYKEAWRQEIAKYFYILSDAFLEVAEMEVYEYDNKGRRQKVKKKNLHSRAVVLSSMETQGKLDDEGPEILAWYVRPGDCFIPALTDPGYQTALLSQKALQYDYNKYKYEKRLTRYFTHLWRMKNPKERLRVKTLLNEIRLEIYDKRPGRTKDRLEAALNRLKEDDVIAAWEYENKTQTNKKGWLPKWLESVVIINMPEYLLEHYKQIKRPEGG